MPVEIMLLPRWFPFHLDKISYWAAPCIVPLLGAAGAEAAGAQSARASPSTSCSWSRPTTRRAGAEGAAAEGLVVLVLPRHRRRAARRRAAVSEADRASARSTARWPWSTERLNGENGLGAIFPAMANSVMMFDVLGYPEDHPLRAIARASRSTSSWWSRSDEAYCQPCVSPVWDTALTCHALLEVGGERAVRAGAQAASIGWCRGRSSTSRATGRRSGPTCGRAAGRSNTPTRIIPTSTTPPWS